MSLFLLRARMAGRPGAFEGASRPLVQSCVGQHRLRVWRTRSSLRPVPPPRSRICQLTFGSEGQSPALGEFSYMLSAAVESSVSDVQRCFRVPRNGQVSVPVAELVERQLKLQGNLVGGAEEAYQVMEYIKQGLLKPLFTEIRLEDIPEYLQKLTDCKTIGKAVAKIGGESWEAPKCFCAA